MAGIVIAPRRRGLALLLTRAVFVRASRRVSPRLTLGVRGRAVDLSSALCSRVRGLGIRTGVRKPIRTSTGRVARVSHGPTPTRVSILPLPRPTRRPRYRSRAVGDDELGADENDRQTNGSSKSNDSKRSRRAGLTSDVSARVVELCDVSHEREPRVAILVHHVPTLVTAKRNTRRQRPRRPAQEVRVAGTAIQ